MVGIANLTNGLWVLDTDDPKSKIWAGLASSTAFVSRNAETESEARGGSGETPEATKHAFLASQRTPQTKVIMKEVVRTAPVLQKKKATTILPTAVPRKSTTTQGVKSITMQEKNECAPCPEEIWSIYELDETEDYEFGSGRKFQRNFIGPGDDGGTY